MSKKKKPDGEFQMARNPKKDGWFDGQKYIPFKDMSNHHLQTAKLHAQRKELIYWNTASNFAKLAEKLDKEAARRGLELRDYNTEYHKKTADYHKRQKLEASKNDGNSDIPGK